MDTFASQLKRFLLFFNFFYHLKKLALIDTHAYFYYWKKKLHLKETSQAKCHLAKYDEKQTKEREISSDKE